jgi:hypothetical protein
MPLCIPRQPYERRQREIVGYRAVGGQTVDADCRPTILR